MDELLVIEGLSSDLNLSKTTMAALDIKWSFKEEFIQIKGEKIPLVKSGKKTELLGIEGKSGRNECVELPHLNKEERVNLYPTSELEIPPNNEINILLKAREKGKKQLDKGARDVIVFPNLKMLKKKGLLANTNAICSKGKLLLKIFNPFSTGVKISKHDNLAFGLKADKNNP